MEREKHITMLKKLIEQNEKQLSELRNAAAELEQCRQESVERHAERRNKITFHNSDPSLS